MADFTSRRMSFLVWLLCLSLAHAYNHVIYDGWKLNPSEGHNHWAERHRFQINDEIVFKYKKGDDSVLVVGEDDYKNCRKDNPIKNLTDGYSVVKFDRSGYFFFISGHDHNCEKGQKMIILSIADRSHHHPKPPSPPVNPPSHSPSPSTQPPSHSPSPATPPHSHSPSPSPSTAKPPTHPPSLSPSPATPPPSHSPSPAPSTAKPPTHEPPVQPPSHSPSPATQPPSHSASPSPSTVKPPSPTQAPPPSHSPSLAPSAKTPSPSPPVNPPSAYAPPVQPPHHSPPSPAPAASHDSPPPQPHAYPPVYLPPQHAPAPAPSSASSFGGSFILNVGLGVATILISSRIIV